MNRIMSNFLRSIALFIPTALCLYSTNLYALNVFRFVTIYSLQLDQKITGIKYGVTSIVTGAVCYFIFLAVWWALLKAVWKNHPRWTSPKSWLDIFINGLISTICLYIAFFCIPNLWIYGNVFMPESLAYTNYIIEKTFSGFIAIWFIAVNLAYAFKDAITQSSARSVEFRNSNQDDDSSSHPPSNDRRADIAELQQQLIALVRDRKTADRLLQGLKRQYPDRSKLWLLEKAISDIHRDRRAY